ncbi:MAG: 3-deoxy-D-manno-octulosonic acid transferase [Pseudomonadota bacterium]
MIFLYRWLSFLFEPLINLLLWRRKRSGKEDPERMAERKGLSRTKRPAGRLIWIHAASVGESLSVLPLAQSLLAKSPDLHVLITTGTVSSARILAKQLPDHVIHQYVPMDLTVWVRRFLDHWRPELAVWIESEFWPNLMLETAARGIPMALVNGRMSEHSYRRWRLSRRGIMQLLKCFRVLLARDEQSVKFFRDIGAAHARTVGDLKLAADALPVDEAELARLRAAIGARPVWLAASTHPGEEDIVQGTHAQVRRQFPGLLSIIAPRHADRGVEIAARLAGEGLKVVRRSTGELPGPDTDIYLADTMGEMGLIYRLAPIAFVGGSLVPHGGQNPLEPARLGCAILYGPYTDNFTGIYAGLNKVGAARQISEAAFLADNVAMLLGDKQAAASRGRAAKAQALKGRDKVLEHIIEALEPLLPKPE